MKVKAKDNKVLFKPKGGAGLTEAQWISKFHGSAGFDNKKAVADSSHLRCRSADLITPRRVAGEHKGTKAEGYYATCLWTEAMLKREQERRY